MTSIWWDFSIFSCCPCYFIDTFKRAGHSMAVVLFWMSHLLLSYWMTTAQLFGVHDASFPILTYQHRLWFSLKCCSSPTVLINALSTAPLEFTQHCKSSSLPKAKGKGIHFHLHFLSACSDSWYNSTLQLFKQTVHYPLCITLSSFTFPKVLLGA